MSCVQQYFIDGQRRCPVCGIVDDGAQQQPGAATQPDDGVMMVTYDNAFRLPGYETTSRGTIVVCYSFPPGLQKATKLGCFVCLKVFTENQPVLSSDFKRDQDQYGLETGRN